MILVRMRDTGQAIILRAWKDMGLLLSIAEASNPLNP